MAICVSVVACALSLGLPAQAAEAAPRTDGDLDIARRLENAFEKVADQASESVVVITSVQKAKPDASDDEDNSDNGNDNDGRQFRGTPWEYFFRRHGLRRPQPRDVEDQGSGIVIRRDGYILTNNHVVDGADNIEVRLKDGRVFEDAKLVGKDKATDIAVIKVDGKDLPVARLGDSDKARVGQWAIAIGAPYELDYTFTVGFVSAKGRANLGGADYENYIQTDAAINPGNSGGPLCDIEGRVIGVNTLIRGLNRGIGFAIPINMAREIADQLIARGRVVRPWIGVAIEPLADDEVLRAMYKDLTDGVVVRAISPNTPAAASDLQPADIIVSVDGAAVKTPQELQQQILHKQIGQKVVLDVLRDGKRIQVVVQTAEMTGGPRPASRRMRRAPSPEATLGVVVQTLTKDLARQLDLEETGGVVVTEVADDSPAQAGGLQHGDVITAVNRQPVGSSETFKAAIAKADTKKGVLLSVKREGAATFVVLREK